MKNLSAIILAAGKGTRMKSALPKVLHPLCGKPMLAYPIEALQQIKCPKIVLVVGHQAEEVQKKTETYKGLFYALQNQQLGSGHAVLAAEQTLKKESGDCFILSGDAPLITSQTLKKILKLHQKNKHALTLATFKTHLPKGYGRIVRNAKGLVERIVEESDLVAEQASINEVNAGLYVATLPLLFEALKKIKKNPLKHEYYFTDLLQILRKESHSVGSFLLDNSEELQGVNSKLELSQAEEKMLTRIRSHWMLNGVSLQNPESIYIENGVKISQDVTLAANVRLEGKTQIGSGCIIEQGALLKNTILKQNVKIKAYSYLEESIVEDKAAVGPFAHLRPGSHLGKSSKVGNFVELKKTQLGEGSKASHLSYIGDARIGKNVNIGAGTITCNYDGKNKFQTILEDDVFIGSDTQLVAPVKVGKGAYIGAGTTVTKEVPEGSLAISRCAQKNILGYGKRKKIK
ncbi:MAG: bifunctional UDP-N-acetylglucosamine diphosphorylase/glucosamine-1-phosphate N-acetyltransferase GlmU [Deltaproteobacteria bacterium]|nr:bifunctional UDP-N-acetylglucosamine diphosphorylase/glucosamine-1-phosphate N-acetyltransferase GlmU [Deltaproteobacteria bacterium]